MILPDLFQFIYHKQPDVLYTAKCIDDQNIHVSWRDAPSRRIKAGDAMYGRSRVEKLLQEGTWIMQTSVESDEDSDFDLISIL